MINLYFSLEAIILFVLNAVCIAITAWLLKKLPIHSQSETPSRNQTLDGIRGVLALSVVAHHFYITFYWKTNNEWVAPKVAVLNNLGAVSVSLFFLITGYLFLNRIRKTDLNWRNLYLSRVKRIYPLYLFALFFIVILTIYSTNNHDGLLRWLKHWLLFRGGNFADFPSVLTIAGVQWTLRYEWGFYLLLPIIYMLWHRTIIKTWWIWLVVVLGIYTVRKTEISFYYLFLLALPSVFWQKQITQLIQKFPKITHIFMYLLLLLTLFFTQAYTLIQMVGCAIIFTGIASGYSYGGILTHKGMKILGDISFSIYLLHGLVLYFAFTIFGIYDFSHANIYTYTIFMPLIYILTIILSLITYRWIERPLMKK